MRVRACTNEVVSKAPAHRRPTTYRACERCGDGAIAWDERRGESRCTACDAPYTGPSDGRGPVPC